MNRQKSLTPFGLEQNTLNNIRAVIRMYNESVRTVYVAS